MGVLPAGGDRSSSVDSRTIWPGDLTNPGIDRKTRSLVAVLQLQDRIGARMCRYISIAPGEDLPMAGGQQVFQRQNDYSSDVTLFG